MELAEKIKAHHIDVAEELEAQVNRGSYETLKRAFDLFLAFFLLPFLLPLIILIAILIKFDSKGSIIFSHRRVGKGGQLFNCYKFRTMVENAEKLLPEILKNSDAHQEWKNDFKLRDDPRVTRIGKILRKFSFDELPQIFNVVKGDMSFVGPRPIVKEEIKKYGRDFECYMSVRPGITGLWQISGRNDTDYSKRVRLDKKYISEYDFSSDLKILLKTLPVVISKRGAY